MPNSLTELDAVKPKGPRIFVALVAALGLAAAAWALFGRDSDGPIGEPEDPARVVLIGATPEVAQVLPQLGLEVEAAELDTLAERARDEGAPSESSAIDAVLYWADLHGYGYVAFADPSTLDFGARAVSSDSADLHGAHGFAVFSVGDLAFPPKVTVDPLPATYPLPAYVELLRALFEQDRLAATLLAEDNQSIEAKPLYERIRAAVDLKGAYGLVDQHARATEKDYRESVVAEEEATAKPRALRTTLEETRAWPLANGRLLLLTTAPSLIDPHTEDVEMSWNTTPRAFVADPGDGTRLRCPAQDAWANADVRVDPTGAVVLVAASEPRLYDVFTVAPSAEGCSFTAAGSLATGHARGALSPTARLARLRGDRDDPGGPVVEILGPHEDHPMEWELPGCETSYGVDWLDAGHVVVLCDLHQPSAVASAVTSAATSAAAGEEREPDATELSLRPEPRPAETSMYLVDIATGEILALPWRSAERRGQGVFRVPGSTLRLAARSWDGTIELGTLALPLSDLLAAPPLDTTAVPPPGVTGSAVRMLSAGAVSIQVIAVDDSADVPVVSPTGTHLSYTVDTGSRWAQNLAVLDLRTQSQTRIAINRWALHRQPAFTADGSKLVFSSLYSLRNGEGHVAQIVAVP